MAPQPTSNHPSDSLELVRNLGEELVTSPPGFESPQSSRHKHAQKDQSEASSSQSDSSDSDSSSSSESSQQEDKQAAVDSPQQGSSHKRPLRDDDNNAIEDGIEPPSKKRNLGAHRKITWIPPPPVNGQAPEEAEKEHEVNMLLHLSVKHHLHLSFLFLFLNMGIYGNKPWKWHCSTKPPMLARFNPGSQYMHLK